MAFGNADRKMSRERIECFHVYILMLENKLFKGTYFLLFLCQPTLGAYSTKLGFPMKNHFFYRVFAELVDMSSSLTGVDTATQSC